MIRMRARVIAGCLLVSAVATSCDTEPAAPDPELIRSLEELAKPVKRHMSLAARVRQLEFLYRESRDLAQRCGSVELRLDDTAHSAVIDGTGAWNRMEPIREGFLDPGLACRFLRDGVEVAERPFVIRFDASGTTADFVVEVQNEDEWVWVERAGEGYALTQRWGKVEP